MKLISLLLILSSFPLAGLAQDDDYSEIQNTVRNYVEGWRNGDEKQLSKAFDYDAGVVLWIDSKEKPEKLRSMTLYDLAQKVKPHENYGIGYTIESLNVIDAELATITVKIPLQNNYYIDCLQLQKINGNWKIVLKSFVYFREGN